MQAATTPAHAAAWILALGVFASLPFMPGFIPLTWMSLVGHVALGLGAAWTFEALEERAA
ncbi:MAG: hypothetical protein KDG89_00640 [Geminicoccaceae bacterium]|nr:hypothetical protein [Geminicoccaceae bacterium]